MRMDDLDEMYAWMCAKRVLVCETEGMKLCLDPSALPVIVREREEGEKEPGWDEDTDQETPQEKIRREFMAKHGIVDDNEVIE